jgi:hypothetical protein
MTMTIFETNYFNEIPIDLKQKILYYTIPKPPPLPKDLNKTYDFNTITFRKMKYLVEHYPTSYVMKKRYNNIYNLFDNYVDNYVMKLKPIPYSKKYQFNKIVEKFCEDHSTPEFQKKYKMEKRNGFEVSQVYKNRKGKYY